jgi:hypothetical protein
MRRRALIFLLWLIALSTGVAEAQQGETYNRMVRVYEDNDIINIKGNGTDQGYTNGTRLDLFYLKKQPSRFFIDRLMPKAGDSSINTFGWGIMQIMITPTDISKKLPDGNDYPYSGSLFITHSLHATNPIKKFNLQTEWMIGVMGPPSLAKETQTIVHGLISYQKPMGWDHQLKTDPLLNLTLAAEKQLLNINKSVEVIGGAQVFGGTALNGAAAYSIIRFGKMEPYFNGYISQYTSKKGAGARRQIYFIMRPSVEWMLTNALIEGGIFNHSHEDKLPDDNESNPYIGARIRERVVAKFDYGLVLSSGRIGLSFTQTTITPVIKGMGNEIVGNISLHVAL